MIIIGEIKLQNTQLSIELKEVGVYRPFVSRRFGLKTRWIRKDAIEVDVNYRFWDWGMRFRRWDLAKEVYFW